MEGIPMRAWVMMISVPSIMCIWAIVDYYITCRKLDENKQREKK